MRGVSRTRFGFAVACVALAACVTVATGCTPAASEKTEPKVSPPAIRKAGTLKIGVDLSYPPFGGTDSGKQAGIDIDIGSAVAGKLGLTAEFVDVKPSEAATALASGKTDVVLSVPYTQESLSRTTLAGSYLSDGPALFVATESTAAVEPSMTLDTLPAVKIGAQEGSAAYWKLQSEFGSESLVGYPTLREALNGLRVGTVRVAAGDAIVAGYIIRDMPTVRLAGQLEPAVPLGVAVAIDNVALSDAVRTTLDGLAADGVLDTIRTKWVGSLPKLKLPESADASPSAETTVTP